MLFISADDRSLMTSHNRSMTFSSVWNTSFLKPRFRISFHICSMGFISGVYGGMKKSSILSGTQRDPAFREFSLYLEGIYSIATLSICSYLTDLSHECSLFPLKSRMLYTKTMYACSHQLSQLHSSPELFMLGIFVALII